MSQAKQRVIVALSGGVDSAVAAALLLEQGYEVIGVTMQLWPADLPYHEAAEGGCCSLGAIEDARAVAAKLGIAFYPLNFQELFRDRVVDRFVSEYLKGRTPNPCIVCNQQVKFNGLLQKAQALGGDFLATGHYVRREAAAAAGRWLLRRGVDPVKDQSYVLYGLTQEQLARCLFPIGEFTKATIRDKATALGLAVAQKPDSQEICFIPDQDYPNFIKLYRPEASRPGRIRDLSGAVLGEHQGIHNFTIGQRKGMGIAAPEPLYVVELRPETNEVIVGGADSLWQRRLLATDLNWIAFPKLTGPLEVTAKIRYGAPAAAATIQPVDQGAVAVVFTKPQRAITPGQAVVFYQGDLVVGGGTIEQAG